MPFDDPNAKSEQLATSVQLLVELEVETTPLSQKFLQNRSKGTVYLSNFHIF